MQVLLPSNKEYSEQNDSVGSVVSETEEDHTDNNPTEDKFDDTNSCFIESNQQSSSSSKSSFFQKKNVQ